MFGFIKKAAKGLGGIVKKAAKVAGKVVKKAAPILIGGPILGGAYLARKPIIKGATWIMNRAKDLIAKGIPAAEAEAQAADEAKQPEPTGAFPWWIVGAAAGVLFVIVLIVLLTAPKHRS